MIRRKSKRKRGDDVKQKLLSINADKSGCEEIKGEYNPKSKQCDIRQELDEDLPDQVTHKKFDSVKRPDEIGGVQKVEDED